MPEQGDWLVRIHAAIDRRDAIASRQDTDTFRVFHGEAEGINGLFIDRFGPFATLIRHEGRTPTTLPAPNPLAQAVLRLLAPLGVRAVYDKPFIRDRSSLGSERAPALVDPAPISGERMPESLVVIEHGRRFEVRPFDGFSTGLFLDQRDNRTFLAKIAKGNRVLNTFAYTGGFSVACAIAGAETTSVDISGRYLEWAKRNFVLNGIDPSEHHFARMDTREFLSMAKRKGMQFDLVILDPPTFAAGDRRKGVRPWSAARDYSGLVRDARAVTAPGGRVFASTNCAELCEKGRLQAEVTRALGAPPRWTTMPEDPQDFPGRQDRANWVMFEV